MRAAEKVILYIQEREMYSEIEREIVRSELEKELRDEFPNMTTLNWMPLLND